MLSDALPSGNLGWFVSFENAFIHACKHECAGPLMARDVNNLFPRPTVGFPNVCDGARVPLENGNACDGFPFPLYAFEEYVFLYFGMFGFLVSLLLLYRRNANFVRF